MERKHFKELWRLRFEKMLALEKQGAEEYQTLLNERQGECQASSVIPHLKLLINEEKKHIHLVEELLEMVNRQPD